MTIMPRQDNRAAVLTTPGENDYLVVSRFDGSEAVSELFEYRIEAASIHADIDFDDFLGKNITLTLKSINGAERHFDGILTESQWLGVRGQFHVYRLVLRPWLWLLSYRTDCFIFHNQTVADIVRQVFARHSFASFEDRTGGTYPVLEYCVQYRESDLAFVCRLLEEFGISFFFEHEQGQHKLILVDNNSKYDPAPGESRSYIPLSGQDRRTEECFNHWIPERRFTSGRATLRDYNFKTPKAQMEAVFAGTGSYEHADQEIYDYPGRYEKQPDGRSVSSLRLQAEEAQDRRCLATGNCVTIFPGSTVNLNGHPISGYDKEYVVLRSQHTFVSQSYRSGGAATGEDSYEGQYELLSSEIPFRPAAITRKPLVHGPQTAFVVGADGEEIDCDEYGRILVRFHWDRNNDQSMRCRVAQTWASRRWGGMIIPRIGMEVVVEFLEGDPDRPLVTGCVYNGDSMPPYTLPQFKTRSTLMSDSHKGTGFNEFRFEDERDEEEVFLHAQKYLNAIVLDNETWKIGGNRDVNITKSASQSIGGDKDMTVSGSHREVVDKERHVTIGASHYSKIGGAEHVQIADDQILEVGGAMHASSGGDMRIEAGGKGHTKIASNYFLDAGKQIVIEAGLSICLKVGGNFISITPAGIQIEGTMVRVNCGGSPSSGSPVSRKKPERPKAYAGPHATRYPRSSQK